MKRGDVVQLTDPATGVTLDGWIALASPGGASLMVLFDGLIDGCAGSLPLLRADDGRYHNVMTGRAIEVRGEPSAP
jgi:hypothetical protein